jgi:hypothetical protein
LPRVRFTQHLARYFPGLADGEYEGATVAEVVRSLDRAHPGLGDYVTDERGALRTHVNVFVGTDLVRDRERLSDAVPGGETVSIFQALSGG